MVELRDDDLVYRLRKRAEEYHKIDAFFKIEERGTNHIVDLLEKAAVELEERRAQDDYNAACVRVVEEAGHIVRWNALPGETLKGALAAAAAKRVTGD